MSSRTKRMRAKADALFEHNPNYTFRQLMVSYRFWKMWIKRNECYIPLTDTNIKSIPLK